MFCGGLIVLKGEEGFAPVAAEGSMDWRKGFVDAAGSVGESAD